MFHKLMTLIIEISFCLIAREITALKCPKNEVLKFSTPRHLPPCGNKRISGKWKFGTRCICAHNWLVRSATRECIPVWMCPHVCPPNEEFNHCTNDYQQLMPSGDFTAEKILKLCKPVCSCKEGYVRNIEHGKCIWAPFRSKFISNRG